MGDYMPCYLCADPAKHDECSTSVCADCGQRLMRENARLRYLLGRVKGDINWERNTGKKLNFEVFNYLDEFEVPV